jgi:hypothetical protein
VLGAIVLITASALTQPQQRVFEIRMTDRGIVHELLSPDVQEAHVDGALSAARIRPGRLLRDADTRVTIDVYAGARHSGRPGQHGGVGYYTGRVVLRKPYYPLVALDHKLEMWQMVGAHARVRATLELSVARVHWIMAIPVVHRIVDRAVTRAALQAEQLLIEEYVRDYHERRDHAREKRRAR